MPEVRLYNIEGQETGNVNLNQNVFGVKINESVVHKVIVAQLAAKRAGTAKTKTRGQVSGGGRKPWRQKGTGRARHGSIRSPLWVGGGTTFGPQPRSYKKRVPKKVKKLAVKSILTSKVGENKLVVLDNINFPEPKTKKMLSLLSKFGVANDKVLIIVAERNDNVYKSARNLQGVRVVTPNRATAYDLLNSEKVIMTQEAVSKVEEVLS